MGAEWEPGHDRLLAFVYRCVGGCVPDRTVVAELTVDLVAEVLDSPNLDDDRVRSRVVALVELVLGQYAEPTLIEAAVRYAAWRDRVGVLRDPHAAVAAVHGFTRHLRVPA
ncbi:hypothetical protein [Actinokineospora inagensis]|uniref:hypothetical protein n=1 Tax=Actinokineospora inagensis TaxID=103730 RepID=UPI0004099AEF|nr:hypothetical protein [Actinokineospora inagensis]